MIQKCNRLKEYMEKIKHRFFGHELSMKLVLFNIIVCCGVIGGIISFIASLSLKMAFMQIMTIVIAVMVGVWCLYIANFQEAVQTAIVGACITVSIFVFPIMFFTGGGLHSGMPIWLVLGIFFSFLLLERTQLFIILGMQVAVDTVCFLVAYYFPEIVTPIDTEAGRYIDMWQSMMIISLVIGAIISFQNSLYVSMLRREETQNKQLTVAREEAEKARTELLIANKAFKELAYTDIMTQLRNRTAFEEKMNSLREQTKVPNTIIMLADVNNLKHINDDFGHSFGDDAIVRVAHCLCKCFTEKCNCFRIGGDEYCVIGEGVTVQEFEKWYNHFETEFEQQVQQVEYPFSIATGFCEVGDQGVDACFKDVDKKMYGDKSMMKKFLSR